jgi:hypothetical protein
MAFWSVQERVGIEVRHVLDQERLYEATYYYCATSMVARRPDQGTAGEQVRCGHCGEMFKFTVCCARLTRQRRFWSFGIAIASLGSGVGLVFVGLSADASAANSPGRWRR